jgi:hypothetical protein
MSDSHVNWWMDASCRWHQGLPPPDWWQARAGRWHPPAPDDTTGEMTIGPPVGGAHLAGGGRWTNIVETYRGWPRWARLAGPVAASILVVGVLGAAATNGLPEGDGQTTATGQAATSTEPETTTTTVPNAATAPTATADAATAPTASVPNTTSPTQADAAPTSVAASPAPPPPTSPSTTNNEIHQAAPCSPEGATALSDDGVPMTCTTLKCHGAPYSEPRWRRTAC